MSNLPSQGPRLKLNRRNTGLVQMRPLKIMQFGGGKFLRAFVDWMVDILNEETGFNGGVAIVKPTAIGDYSMLRSQDGLYTVLLEGFRDGLTVRQERLISCVQEIIEPHRDWQAFLALAENETLRFIVSNTTESGIRFHPGDSMGNHPHGTFPAKLTVWLHHRFKYFMGDPEKGCIILPCELIENNGDALKNCIMQYAGQWGLGGGFQEWLMNANHFCQTLVDRIVSGFPEDRASSIPAGRTYEDPLLVMGEYYHEWVIQAPAFVRKELPFHMAGLQVFYTDDLTASRKLKVRILNGAHTMMVPIGLLGGLVSVRECMEDPFTGSFIREAIYQEAIPTFGGDIKSAETYANATFERFMNPYIHHRLAAIALNSISKFKVRVLPSILEYHSMKNTFPPHLLFAFACLIRFYKGVWKGAHLPVSDEVAILDEMAGFWKSLSSGELISAVLSHAGYWGWDLTKVPGLEDAVGAALEYLEEYGLAKGFAGFCGRKG